MTSQCHQYRAIVAALVAAVLILPAPAFAQTAADNSGSHGSASACRGTASSAVAPGSRPAYCCVTGRRFTCERPGGEFAGHRAQAAARSVAMGHVPGGRHRGESGDGRPCLCLAADLDHLVCQGDRAHGRAPQTALRRSTQLVERARWAKPIATARPRRRRRRNARAADAELRLSADAHSAGRHQGAHRLAARAPRSRRRPAA